MKKMILMAAMLGCSISVADAMPMASAANGVSGLPVVQADVVVRRTVVRRRAPVVVRRSRVVKKVIVR